MSCMSHDAIGIVGPFLMHFPPLKKKLAWKLSEPVILILLSPFLLAMTFARRSTCPIITELLPILVARVWSEVAPAVNTLSLDAVIVDMGFFVPI